MKHISKSHKRHNQKMTESEGNINIAKSKTERSLNGNIEHYIETGTLDLGRIQNGVRIIGS